MPRRQCFCSVLSLFILVIAVTPQPAEKVKTNQVNPDEDPTTVQTKSGPIVGTTVKSLSGKEVNVYYGIPFAQSPTGSLRFRPPVKVAPWTSTLKAVTPSPICFQLLPTGSELLKPVMGLLQRPWSEDCLTLNVWSPRPKVQNAPVIAYIHGGAFVFGSSLMSTDGSTLAAEGAVVVTLNYRLAVFGFFGLDNADAPGNSGLLDQHMALTWIKENVEAFGGDPNLVTLMGTSAGSASVGLQFLSPMSEGLFSRVVMFSGAATNHWAVKELEDNADRSKKLLDVMGCSTVNLTLGLDCIRQKDPQDVLEASSSTGVLENQNFKPTIDGHFLKELPSVSVAAGRLPHMPLMISSAVDEGAMFLIPHLKFKDGRVFKKDFRKLVRKVDGGPFSSSQMAALEILYTDLNSDNDPYALRNAAKEIYSDVMFVCGINELTEGASRAGLPVYRYVFGHTISGQAVPGQEWVGSLHGDDHKPLLGPREMIQDLPKDHPDRVVFARFVKHIMKFVVSGDPNIDESLRNGQPAWPQYSNGRQHLFFALNSTVVTGLKDKECRILNTLLPELADKSNC